jgi:hypothetical protein
MRALMIVFVRIISKCRSKGRPVFFVDEICDWVGVMIPSVASLLLSLKGNG